MPPRTISMDGTSLHSSSASSISPSVGAPNDRPAMAAERTASITRDGRVAFYQGDDERFDYLYKFVTAGKYNAADRART